ncbi:hypothetical protein ANN_27048 [Periplaneta americana]|uniref:DUF4817 domain-containing protein n=1 Tax=Periplaneta americana TaxID=6978 RepID=A0ABQ8RWY7_PERAM|nr:hypothetical protein ANN_27048 [Periplaneta americana]
MAGLCEGGNEPVGSLKPICNSERATGVAQSAKELACDPELRSGAGSIPAWADWLVGLFPRFSPIVRQMSDQSNHQLRMDVYTFPELADMVMCYGEDRGNGRRALQMYQQQFQNRNHTMFDRLYQSLRDDGFLRPRRIGAHVLQEYLEDVLLATRIGMYFQQTGTPAHSSLSVIHVVGSWVVQRKVTMVRYTNREQADMVFTYGQVRGNGRAAARLYQEKYPIDSTRNIQRLQDFLFVVWGTGSFKRCGTISPYQHQAGGSPMWGKPDDRVEHSP